MSYTPRTTSLMHLLTLQRFVRHELLKVLLFGRTAAPATAKHEQSVPMIRVVCTAALDHGNEPNGVPDAQHDGTARRVVSLSVRLLAHECHSSREIA